MLRGNCEGGLKGFQYMWYVLEAEERFYTAVVLNADGDVRGANFRGDVRWSGGVDQNGLVSGGIVGGPCCYADEEVIC